MTRHPRPAGATSARLLVLWLVACLLPLHGMASGLLTVLGPQHVHQTRPAIRVLDDVRRSPMAGSTGRLQGAGPLGSMDTHTLTHALTLTHGHAHDTLQRHHHRHDDASVVKSSGTVETAAGDADDAVFSPALGAFLALLDQTPAWLPPAGLEAFATGPGWALLTHTPLPLDRPPQSS